MNYKLLVRDEDGEILASRRAPKQPDGSYEGQPLDYVAPNDPKAVRYGIDEVVATDVWTGSGALRSGYSVVVIDSAVHPKMTAHKVLEGQLVDKSASEREASERASKPAEERRREDALAWLAENPDALVPASRVLQLMGQADA